MADVETVPLWERQSWDTEASWDRFHRFYLVQDAPRSLNEAYRRYRSEQGQDKVSENEAPGTWRKWFRGQDSTGKVIPGATTWEERAQAWDNHQAELDRQRWEERRQAVREQDWALGDDLRKLAAEMLKQAPRFVKGSRSVIKGKDGSPDREVVTMELTIDALFKAAKLASDLQRLAAEIAPPVQQHKVTGAVVNVTADDLAAAREMAQKLEEDLLDGGSSSPDDSDTSDNG
jgi:hypothetical protein